MRVLLAYDMACDRRRNRFAKGLESFLVRVQKSVFEGELTQKQILDLEVLIDECIDPTEDSVRLYNLCKRCELSLKIMGYGDYVEPPQDEVI